MKGVILGRAPQTPVVDLCHELPPQDVSSAALALRSSVSFFPEGTLFVVVVDPGVGSSRRILWARSRRHRFLAPDNGVLSWLSDEDRILERRVVTNRRLFLSPVSSTFHGRDIFAPVAAALSRGLAPSALGKPVADPAVLPWPAPSRLKAALAGRILAFDRFGNAVTNLPSAGLPEGARFVHRARDLGPLRSHYAEVPSGRSLAVSGSSGLVELSTRGGDYAAKTRARRGDTVHVRYRR